MISRLLSSFAVVSSISAFVLDNPLQLLQASAGVNNTTIITTTNNKNILPLFSLPPSPNPSSNFPITSLVSYVCNGDAFGHDLNVDSCTDAIRFLGVNTTQLSFGMRNTGAFDIGLPQRYISSDGKCAIEPTLEPDKELARASAEDVAVAAFVVVRNCAAKQGGKGGIAKDIGGDDNLRIVVSKYDPAHVRCYGKMRRPQVQVSCQGILDSMRTSNENVYFGPRGDPLTNVGLPFSLFSG
ncbi:hypothetical protein HO133_006563 [Letharia lupina]|uniref:Uncharacterized protein n=1 Tax=Letharia lupina TaxID=560253 RepID=A0A8H6C6X5_9LECA|nr:uncharacterized protein HO133_006563 [Letharia lupina]KAF6217736.1 hypothetical protein HO133_006563 [Letharia lupina]